MFRRLFSIAVLAAVSTCNCAAGPPGVPFPPDKLPPPPILPADFAGWRQAVAPQRSTAPEAADQANAAVLHEYGFAEFAAANYTQPDNKLNVRAIRFQDATGAYGAFTFYRRPGMLKEDIGSDGAFDGAHVLFWTGTIVIDATFDHLTAMSAAQLRELANDLPKTSGPTSVAPPLPKYLPITSLNPNTVHYAVGPVAYARSGGVLPPNVIDFDREAEAVTANYTTQSSDGTLTLLMYPTPQMAIHQQQTIQTLLKTGNSPQAAWPQALADSNEASLLVRRSGPLIAITSGSFSVDEARKLLNSINYSADITWNHPEGYVSEASKTARLLLGIAYLTGILGAAAIILGLFFGGGRAALRRLRGKPISTLNDEEFISLKLR
ncbi:hypothetical protein H7849_18290 [Alloacidobacterium dinghuense]|uniref:DUF2167 domain-containing protein n=1 Tax=Alloacidobacterium dinghuense TaxID=2763107 RepID=A0A7G8BES0_9BACT|nr:DUF6599 family protein [Alloacidobacterium dinghuense]QNI31040.1 hypothetical protein H7849_18290 [Alloacidobacterium dinghuense]